jgi:hypothetical protein
VPMWTSKGLGIEMRCSDMGLPEGIIEYSL